MLVVPAITPSVDASLLGGIQALMSVMQVAGAVVFLLGAILFLCVLRRDRAEAVCRLPQGSGGMRQADDVRERPPSASGNPLSPRRPTADNGPLAGQVKSVVT